MRGLEAEAPAFGDFLQVFNENNTSLGTFRFKFLLKNIFLISLIIQNG